MKETILKYVLKNALDFNGKVNDKVVLGLTLKEYPKQKSNVPKTLEQINQVIKEVQKKSSEQIKEELKKIAPELLQDKKVEQKGPLKELNNAKNGKVVLRLAPSPSGALHIGHSYGASINNAYKEMYKGKLILRIEDTNPANIYSNGYELIEKDVKWLTDNNVDEVIIQSDRLGIYYDYAEKLVSQGDAYVCLCNADSWREMKSKGKACLCRSISADEQLIRFSKMFSSYAEGEAVLRMKTDINHKNPAMRDFSLMRICEHVHPRKGKEHRVWPLMVLSVAIDDHLLGLTHVINGKDQADNSKKEKFIMEAFGWIPPEYNHWGFINFKGMQLSSSKTRLAIEQGEYTGWDDIRLPFMPALRRRGYQAKALREFALEIGLTLNDKTVEKSEFWKLVNAKNKEIVEKKANRYFFIENPVEVALYGTKGKIVKIDLHPDFAKRGFRSIELFDKVYIAKKDFESLKNGKVYRLMDAFNVLFEKGNFNVVSDSFEEYKNIENKGSIIHFVGKDHLLAEVLLEDNSIIKGLIEKDASKLNVGDIVQLTRFAFCRLDSKDKLMKFWYLHK